MEAGAIGFHDKTKVKRMKVEKDSTIVRALNKTRQVRHQHHTLHISNFEFEYEGTIPQSR